MWDGWWIIGNKAMWAKLPDDIKQIMSTNFEKAAMEQRAAIVADAQKTQDLLHSQGMTVTEPDLDSFRDKLKSTSYYNDWRKKYGDKLWDALNKLSESCLGAQSLCRVMMSCFRGKFPRKRSPERRTRSRLRPRSSAPSGSWRLSSAPLWWWSRCSSCSGA